MKDRRGFTLIELLIVVSILGLLASIATPKVQSARAHARAAEVVGAMRAVRIAATMYYDSAATWPPNASPGAVPNGLAGYLPRVRLFSGNGWQFRWRRRRVVSGGRSTIEGVLQVRTSDPLLCTPLAALLGGASSTIAVSCAGASGRITQTIER